MAKIKNKAAEAAFRIVWNLVAKKKAFEESVIEPIEKRIAGLQKDIAFYQAQLEINVIAAFKLKKGQTIMKQVVENGKRKNVIMRGDNDLAAVQVEIDYFRNMINVTTKMISEAKTDMDKANRQLAAIKGQITKAQKAYENA